MTEQQQRLFKERQHWLYVAGYYARVLRGEETPHAICQVITVFTHREVFTDASQWQAMVQRLLVEGRKIDSEWTLGFHFPDMPAPTFNCNTEAMQKRRELAIKLADDCEREWIAISELEEVSQVETESVGK
jgi:galactose-1-phosphate uridylyltransferase